MAELKEMAQEQGSALVFLLQCLGFTINTEKTVLQPTQTLEFLGFDVNTFSMELSLPTGKLKKDPGKVLEATGGDANIRPCPLQTNWQDKCCQSSYSTSTSVLQIPTDGSDGGFEEGGSEFDTRLCLSENSKEELAWWDTQMVCWNRKTILT